MHTCTRRWRWVVIRVLALLMHLLEQRHLVQVHEQRLLVRLLEQRLLEQVHEQALLVHLLEQRLRAAVNRDALSSADWLLCRAAVALRTLSCRLYALAVIVLRRRRYQRGSDGHQRRQR